MAAPVSAVSTSSNLQPLDPCWSVSPYLLLPVATNRSDVPLLVARIDAPANRFPDALPLSRHPSPAPVPLPFGAKWKPLRSFPFASQSKVSNLAPRQTKN